MPEVWVERCRESVWECEDHTGIQGMEEDSRMTRLACERQAGAYGRRPAVEDPPL